MTTIRSIVVDEEPTLEYFTNLTNANMVVSSSVHSSMLGFFERMTGDKESAKVLTQVVLQTSAANGLDPIEVMDEFKKTPPGELSRYTAMFFNLNRVGTSYLGLTNAPVVSDYVKRTILP